MANNSTTKQIKFNLKLENVDTSELGKVNKALESLSKSSITISGLDTSLFDKSFKAITSSVEDVVKRIENIDFTRLGDVGRGVEHVGVGSEAISNTNTAKFTANITEISNGIINLNNALGSIADGLQAKSSKITGMFKGIVSYAEKLSQLDVSGIDTASKKVSEFIQAISGINAVDTKQYTQKFQEISDGTEKVVNQLGSIAQDTVDNYSTITTGTKNYATSGKTFEGLNTQQALDNLNKLTDGLSDVVEDIGTTSKDIADRFTEITSGISKISSTFKTINEGDFNTFTTSLNGITTAIKDTIKEISSITEEAQTTFRSITSNFKNIPAAAKGIQNVNISQFESNLNTIVTNMQDVVTKISSIAEGTRKAFSGFMTAYAKVGGVSNVIAKINKKEFEDNIEAVGDGLVDLTKKFDKNHVNVFSKAATGAKNIGTGFSKISQIDTATMNRIIQDTGKFFTELNTIIQGIDVSGLSKLGTMMSRYGGGAYKLAKLSDKEYENARTRASTLSQDELSKMEERMWKSREVNEAIKRKNQQDESGWLDDLLHFDFGKLKDEIFGKKTTDENGNKKKEGGFLGLDLKSGISKGIKGGIVGIIVNIIMSAINKGMNAIKFLLTKPLQIMKKIGKGVIKFLTSSIKKAQTFQALIDLFVKPFILIFTLLFAPILAALAPVLAEVIQKVADRWPDLQAAGEKIAEVIEKILSNDQWDILNTVIDLIINTIMWLGAVAEKVFSQPGDMVAKLMVFVLLVVSEMVTALIQWLYGDGRSVLKLIAFTLGVVIYEMIKLGISMLPLMLQGIEYIFAGMIADRLYNIFRGAIIIIDKIMSALKGPLDWIGGLFGNSTLGTDSSKWWNNMASGSLGSVLYKQGNDFIERSYSSYVTNNNYGNSIQGFGTGLNNTSGTTYNFTV